MGNCLECNCEIADGATFCDKHAFSSIPTTKVYRDGWGSYKRGGGDVSGREMNVEYTPTPNDDSPDDEGLI
jgi:hypothetical protein